MIFKYAINFVFAGVCPQTFIGFGTFLLDGTTGRVLNCLDMLLHNNRLSCIIAKSNHCKIKSTGPLYTLKQVKFDYILC